MNGKNQLPHDKQTLLHSFQDIFRERKRLRLAQTRTTGRIIVVVNGKIKNNPITLNDNFVGSISILQIREFTRAWSQNTLARPGFFRHRVVSGPVL